MLPFLPEEKSNQACFWSLTKKDGVFSLLNGDRPLNSRPGAHELDALADDLRGRQPGFQLIEELGRKAHGGFSAQGRGFSLAGWGESVAPY